jgi:hypothetical protein
MKKKILLSVFVVSLALILIGCSGVTPIIPDVNQEEEIRGTVNNYWSALSNKQYELAKIYCIPHGNAYCMVEEYQNLFDYDYVTLNWTPHINYVEINGNEATVNIDIALIVTVCFEDICSTESEILYNYPMYLIRIDDIWYDIIHWKLK